MKRISLKLRCIIVCLLCIVHLSFSQTIDLDSLRKSYDKNPDPDTGLLLLKSAVIANPSLAEQYIDKIQSELNSKDEFLDFQLLKGDLYATLLKYDSAVKIYTNLLIQLKESKKASLQADINDKIGSIYLQLRENEQALSYFSVAKSIREDNNLTLELPKSYYNYGSAQFRLGNHKEAAENFKKGVSSIDRTNQVALLANTYYMLANSFKEEKSFDSALYHFENAKQLYDKIGPDQSKVLVSNEIAQVLIERGEYAEVISILEQNLVTIKTFNNWQYYDRTYGLLVDAYEGNGDYRSALKYEKQKFDTVVSFLISRRTESVAQITEDFRTTKGLDEAEEQLGQTEEELGQAKEQAFFATRRAKIFGGIIGFLAIILIITYLLFTRAIQKKQLENLEAMVLGEENERKRVAKDLHDGIGVLLTSVKLRLSNFQDKVEAKKEFQNSLDQIDNACTEVRRISHNMVPASLTKLGLQEAILDLLDNVSASTDIVIEEALDYKEGAYDESKEVLIYRVIQELINNSLKYADPDKLSVSISKSKQDYLLTYSDNGKGFDKSKIKFGLGLRSIASRVNILKGKLTYESSPGEGAIFNITIPHYG